VDGAVTVGTIGAVVTDGLSTGVNIGGKTPCTVAIFVALGCAVTVGAAVEVADGMGESVIVEVAAAATTAGDTASVEVAA